MIPSLHSVDLRALKLFCQIVECGGFTPAQIKLNASQPVMSNQIRKLEERLGVRLCDRGRKAFSLTDDGRVVYQAALELFSAMDSFRATVARDASELKGELRISLMDNTITNRNTKILETIDHLREVAPGINLALSIGTTVDLEMGVIEGSRDLAIGYFHHRVATLNYQPVFTERHLLYCRTDHPANRIPPSDLPQRLSEFPYVEATYIGDGVDRGTVSWKVAASSANMEAMAFFILSGKYIGFLPAHYAKQWVASGELVALDSGGFIRDFDYHLITSATLPRRPVASMFIEHLMGLLEAEGMPRE